MYKRTAVTASLVLSVMLLSTMPVMAQQLSRLNFTLYANGSCLMLFMDTSGEVLEWYFVESVFNIAGTSLAEETEYDGLFPVYILEEGSVRAAGDLRLKWIADDESRHELRLRLFGTEETSGIYFMFEEPSDPTHPWGLCGMFIPQPFTYQGWHMHDGIKEEISGGAGVTSGCHIKAPDTGTLIEPPWWVIWIWFELDGVVVGICFTELAHEFNVGESIVIPAAQVLTVQTRLT